MFDNKFCITIIGLFLAIFTLCNINSKKETEGFINVPRTMKSSRYIEDPTSGAQSALSNGLEKGDISEVRGTWQSSLAPRFSNVDYGAHIRYNMPTKNKLAVPDEPLTFSNMVSEGFYDQNNPNIRTGITNDKVTGLSNNPPSSYTAGNYNDVIESLTNDGSEISSALPIGDMTTLNSLGDGPTQAIIYDRLMFANQKSRLRSLGDPIRGDLPIVPSKNAWFRPSVQPQVDLRAGALSVMGGIDNQTSGQLDVLQNMSNNGIRTSFAQSSMNVDPDVIPASALDMLSNSSDPSAMSAMYSTGIGEVARQINVTAFP